MEAISNSMSCQQLEKKYTAIHCICMLIDDKNAMADSILLASAIDK